MLDTTRVTDNLSRARAHAESLGLAEELDANLRRLETFGSDPERYRTVLYPDFAPHSFSFSVERRAPDGSWCHVLTGGLLFHGPHDGHGSGAAPTLAVTLEPVHGWSIHT